MSGKRPSESPSGKTPQRNIPGRIATGLAIIVTALTGTDASSLTELGSEGDKFAPPRKGSFCYYVEKFNLWLQAKLEPPKKTN